VWALVTAGCTSADPQPGSSQADPAELAAHRAAFEATTETLAPGSSGDAVRGLHEYLATFGYFPNQELTEKYAAWRAIVPEEPVDPGVFDQNTTAAIMAYQGLNGLPQTGVVDDLTRETMLSPRCGVPDGIPRFDPSEKYDIGTAPVALNGWTWSGMPPAGLSQWDVQTTILAAVSSWEAQSSINLPMVALGSPSAQAPNGVFVQFADLPGKLGNTQDGPAFGLPGALTARKVITLSTAGLTWSVGTPTGTSTDLRSVLEHELGHALGLKHSSATHFASVPPPPPDATNTDGDAVMYGRGWAPGTIKRGLTIDDKVAISAYYDVWYQFPNQTALDIAVGTSEIAWIIGTDQRIYRGTVAGGWQVDASGAHGQRIAVDRLGVPWIIGTGAGGGAILKYSTNLPTTGHFTPQTTMCATDIGIGGDGKSPLISTESAVWIIGCTGTGNHPIYKLVDGIWLQAPDAATRIAVGPTGIPWVVKADGSILSLSTNDPRTGTWAVLSGLGLDIGIAMPLGGFNNYAWVIGTTPVGASDYSIHVLDSQPPCVIPTGLCYAGLGSPPEVYKHEWLRVAGGARTIAVGPKGDPWVINSAGNILTSVR
jgi:peptidoglycan hydrolase-like protein with peptidoglycan-binding domain